jgi:hypothetical protein
LLENEKAPDARVVEAFGGVLIARMAAYERLDLPARICYIL